jgi:CheY-like chemotaxis protein
MTVTCPTCNATLTIPDERLPKGKVVTAACPQCKGKILIDMTGAPPPAPAAAAPAGTTAAATLEQPAGYGEHGQPRALVCVTDHGERDLVLAALRQHRCAISVAPTAPEAIERLRFTAYAVVVLRDGFGSDAGGGNPVLDQIAEMGSAVRRNLHVVLVSPTVRSHDAPTAFAKSVNLVIHPNDLSHLGEALERSRAEEDRTYQVLRESLRAVGKA